MKNILFSLLITLSTVLHAQQGELQLQWPLVSAETKPWTRWWWPGSIGSTDDITKTLEEYRKAGLGGLELTVLYGVRGEEKKFVNYLSVEWMRMFSHILNETKRLKIGLDLANASSWPLGGPWVTPDYASKYVAFKTAKLSAGEKPGDLSSYMQEPSIRWNGTFRTEITNLKDPVYLNENLQELAIDQVRFPKPLPLHSLMAYSEKGTVLNLLSENGNGKLQDWTAPEGNWNLWAVFQGWHGKMVERAGPGGEGYVIDHFSRQAVRNYLSRFDTAFTGYDLSYLRGYFNDSYEVDDARGQANWSPAIFREFRNRRGYDLREHLPSLFQKDSSEKNSRILSDYRLTVSDMILDNFTREWTSWANKQGKITRNQSHGSPANILDLYAASDIPETEGNDILRMKFATSAANISGKKLVSAEAATWLGEHFSSTLFDLKKAADQYFIAGVNHLFYHGTCFSPPAEAWPGYQFYASVELSPANPIWADFPALNSYITRVQSFLQASQPDNDVMLYFPIFDRYADFNNNMLEHFDAISPRFNGSHFKSAADIMKDRGYSFDYISDSQLNNIVVEGNILLSSGNSYRTVILPECNYIPVSTFNRIINLAEKGSTIIFFGKMPADVSGWYELDNNREIFAYLKEQLKFRETGMNGISESAFGKGRILMGENLESLLEMAGTRKETLAGAGIGFSRRKLADGHCYFITNLSDKYFSGWLNLASGFKSAALFDPMNGSAGMANTRFEEGQSSVYLRLAPFGSLIIRTYNSKISADKFKYYESSGNSFELKGTWTTNFLSGGPSLPPAIKTDKAVPWSESGPDWTDFSGTAEYSVEFEKPPVKAVSWLLDLGKVYESARIYLNGNELATLLGPEFQVVIPNSLLKPSNMLSIRVTNLAANRIAYLDRNNVTWKKFYNVNFPARLPANRKNGLFDASGWTPRKSGLEGPVTLTPLKLSKQK